MSFWTLARRTIPRERIRFDLLDFITLLTISKWSQAVRNSRYAETVRGEKLSSLKGILVLVSADVKRFGFDMDLSIDFKDPDVRNEEVATSRSIDQSLDFLASYDLIDMQWREYLDFRVTEYGTSILNKAAPVIIDYEARAKCEYGRDKVKAKAIWEPAGRTTPVELVSIVDHWISQYARRSHQEVRAALVELAFRNLIDGDFPRTYSFEEKYASMFTSVAERRGRRRVDTQTW